MTERLPSKQPQLAGYMPTSVAQRPFRPGAGGHAGKTNGSAHGSTLPTPLGKKLLSSSQPAVSELALDASLSGVSPPPRPSTSMGLHTDREPSHGMADFPDDNTDTRNSTPRLTFANSGSQAFKISNNGKRNIINAVSPQFSTHQQRRTGPASKVASQQSVGSTLRTAVERTMKGGSDHAEGSDSRDQSEEMPLPDPSLGSQNLQPHRASKKRSRQQGPGPRVVRTKLERVPSAEGIARSPSFSSSTTALDKQNAMTASANTNALTKAQLSGMTSSAPTDSLVESDSVDAKAHQVHQRHFLPGALKTRGSPNTKARDTMQLEFNNTRLAFEPDDNDLALAEEQAANAVGGHHRAGRQQEYAIMSDQSDDDDERPAIPQQMHNSVQPASAHDEHGLAQQTDRVREQRRYAQHVNFQTEYAGQEARADEESEMNYFDDDQSDFEGVLQGLPLQESASVPNVTAKLRKAYPVHPSKAQDVIVNQHSHLVGAEVGIPDHGSKFIQSTPRQTQKQRQREDDQTLVEEAEPAEDDEQTAHNSIHEAEKVPAEFVPHPDCRCNSCFIPTGESRDKYHTQTLDEWLSQGDEYSSRLPNLFKKILDVIKARTSQVESLHTKFSDQVLAVEKQQSAIESQRGKIKAWKTGSFLGLAGGLAACAGMEGGSAASTPVRASSV